MSRWLAASLLVSVFALSPSLRAQPTTVIPYQGRLESSGVAVSGAHDFRFALFTAEDSDASCLAAVSQPTDICGLWWGEASGVSVYAGAFAVMLGADTAPLSHAALAQSSVWMAVAVKQSGIAGYTLLASKKRISDVISAATARDFTVSNDLQVDGELRVDGGLHVNGDLILAGDHADSGYIRLGDTQIVWGTAGYGVVGPDSQDLLVNISPGFAAAPVVVASPQDPGWGSAAANSDLGVRGITNSSFRILYKQEGSGDSRGALTAQWIAIGRWR